MEKRCARCKKILPVASFGKRTASPDGLRHSCKTCISKDEIRYRRNNHAAITEKRRSATTKNKSAFSAYHKAYRQSEKGRLINRACSNNWNKANRQKINARTRADSSGLSNYYVRKVIHFSTSLPYQCISQEMIEAKRAHLKLTRYIKEQKA